MRRLLFWSLFLVVFGARLWLIEVHSTPLPFWDQWDAEGTELLKPWLESHLTFPAIFVPHNEHRLVLTRLFALFLFIVNQQWDAQLEMAANALMVASTAALICAGFARFFSGGWQAANALLLALIFALPFGWENTLAGFQSQFYFLTLFSLLALWGLIRCKPVSAGWWVGIFATLLASLSMASGFFVALAWLLFRGLISLVRRERIERADFAVALICLVLVAVGLTSRTTVPGHDVLRAESLPIFLTEAGRCLAWPLLGWPWLAGLMQAPLLIFSYRFLRGQANPRCAELLLTTGLWIWLQIAAIAFSRGTQGLLPASRYQDLLALGALVNFFCAALLLSPRVFSARNFVATAWMICFLAGLAHLSAQNFSTDLPAKKSMLLAEARNVRGYVATGDFAQYLVGKNREEIPFPDPKILADTLDDLTLRKILPYNVRPLVRQNPAAGRSFRETGRCTRALRVLLRSGKFIFAAGCAGLIFGCVLPALRVATAKMPNE